jgi:hypothetical protein
MVMVAIVGTWVSQEVREFLRTVGLLDPHGVTELKTHRSDGSGCDRWRYRLAASIGVVITPIAPLVGHLPHDVIEELITIATSNVYVARTKGGQHEGHRGSEADVDRGRRFQRLGRRRADGVGQGFPTRSWTVSSRVSYVERSASALSLQP